MTRVEKFVKDPHSLGGSCGQVPPLQELSFFPGCVGACPQEPPVGVCCGAIRSREVELSFCFLHGCVGSLHRSHWSAPIRTRHSRVVPLCRARPSGLDASRMGHQGGAVPASETLRARPEHRTAEPAQALARFRLPSLAQAGGGISISRNPGGMS